MDLLQEILPGCWLFSARVSSDHRGKFVKTFQSSFLRQSGLQFELHEEFYSISKSGVVRGLHFQVPPHEHIKIVSCYSGAVLDVLVDLRLGPGYGRVASVLLDESNEMSVYIPPGIAHGFLALRDDSLMVYRTSSEYSSEHDKGIKWDSIDFDWGCDSINVSERDKSHPTFAQFNSPFVNS